MKPDHRTLLTLHGGDNGSFAGHFLNKATGATPGATATQLFTRGAVNLTINFVGLPFVLGAAAAVDDTRNDEAKAS